MAKMKVALEVYTIRELLQTAEGFANAMKAVREIGYEYVELAGSPVDVKEQKRVLDREGLKVCATHTGLDGYQTDLEGVVERHKMFGCEYAVIPWLPKEFHNADGFARFGRLATDVAKKLKKSGLGLAYHNHSFEFTKFDGKTGMEILFDAADPKLVHSELDTYWVQYGGANTVTWIKKLTGRVPLLHLKDMASIDGKQVMAEVGEGNLEWPEILAAAAKAGTRWLVVEEDECQRPCLESVAISFQNLHAMGMC